MPSNNPVSSKLCISSTELADSISQSRSGVPAKSSNHEKNIQKSGAAFRKYRPTTALPEKLPIKITRNISSTKAYITEIPSLHESPSKTKQTVLPHFTITPVTYASAAPKEQPVRNTKQRHELPKLNRAGSNITDSANFQKSAEKPAQQSASPTFISDIHELEKQTMRLLIKKAGGVVPVPVPVCNLKPLFPMVIQHQNRPEGIKSAEQHIKTGYKCIKSFQYTEAICEFDAAIKKCPLKADAYYGKALSFQAIHNFRLAEFYCRETLAREPKRVECLITLGTVCSNSGNHNSAIDAFTRAVKINPSNPEPYFLRGCEYLKASNYNNASEDFLSARTNGYNPVIVFKYEATMFIMQKKYQAALDKYDTALGICPFDAPLHILRAECQELSGNWGAAIGDYKTALNCRPCISDMEKCLSKIDNLSAYCNKSASSNAKITKKHSKSVHFHQ